MSKKDEEFMKCPFCGVELKEKNFNQHKVKAHPREIDRDEKLTIYGEELEKTVLDFVVEISKGQIPTLLLGAEASREKFDFLSKFESIGIESIEQLVNPMNIGRAVLILKDKLGKEYYWELDLYRKKQGWRITHFSELERKTPFTENKRKGLEAYRSGEYEKCIEFCHKALQYKNELEKEEKRKEHVHILYPVYKAMADSMQRLGRYEEAMALWNEAISVAKCSQYKRDAMLEKASILLKLKRIDEAEEICDNVIAEDPSEVDAWGKKVTIALERGKYGKAKKYIEKVLEFESENPFALFLGALICDELNDVGCAKAYRKRLWRIDPFFQTKMYLLCLAEREKKLAESNKLTETEGEKAAMEIKETKEVEKKG